MEHPHTVTVWVAHSFWLYETPVHINAHTHDTWTDKPLSRGPSEHQICNPPGVRLSLFPLANGNHGIAMTIKHATLPYSRKPTRFQTCWKVARKGCSVSEMYNIIVTLLHNVSNELTLHVIRYPTKKTSRHWTMKGLKAHSVVLMLLYRL